MTFPIVAVGASAGGIPAATELVRHLRPDAGVALVLLQHLDRTHPSELIRILARESPLPVRAIEEGLQIEVNQIYVAPPNAQPTVAGGSLHLAPTVRGDRNTIDGLFQSLAADCGTRAAGVLLSGSGSDGTEGIRAIKRAGGATFA